MNRWYSRNNKFMMDLDQVASFEYYDRSILNGPFDPTSSIVNEVKQYGCYILVFAGGREYTFRGPEAVII